MDKIVFFTALFPEDDIEFFKIAMLQFSKVNDYDFIFYVYTYTKELKFDSRFIIKDLKELNPKRYNLRYNHYITLFLFFKFSKMYKNAYICYISNSLICLKSLQEVIYSIEFGEKTSERFQEGVIIAGVKDNQSNTKCQSYRLYARKCLSIRSETYLSQSILITKGFHVYRHEFQEFVDMCPQDLLNPEMDFINWYFKNKIKYLNDCVCSNYTNEMLDNIISYDFNTDVKPTSMPYDYIKYIDKEIIFKIIKDFKIFYDIIKKLKIDNDIIYKISNNQKFIENCLEDILEKDSFTRRYILKCSD